VELFDRSKTLGKTVYVIGHRNPDTDSIASAIAYAALKRRTGLRQRMFLDWMPGPGFRTV